MLLTLQLVATSPSMYEAHGALYLHGTPPLPGILKAAQEDSSSIEEVANFEPGVYCFHLPSGGSQGGLTVYAILDIVAFDTFSRAEFKATCDEIIRQIKSGRKRVSIILPSCAAQFRNVARHSEDNNVVLNKFFVVGDQHLRWLEKTFRTDDPPVRAELINLNGIYRVQWHEGSKERLFQHFGEVPPSISLNEETLQLLVSTRGETAYGEILQSFLLHDPEHYLALGGFELYREDERVWQWPSRPLPPTSANG